MHCRYVMRNDTTCIQRNNQIMFASGRADLSHSGGQCFREGQYQLTPVGFSIKRRDSCAFITPSPLCMLHVIECTHLPRVLCVQRLMRPCPCCSSDGSGSHNPPFSCAIMEKNIFNTAWIYGVLKDGGLNGKQNKVLHQRGGERCGAFGSCFVWKKMPGSCFLCSCIAWYLLIFFILFPPTDSTARTMLVLFGSGSLLRGCSGYWGGFIYWLQKLWLTAEEHCCCC